MKFRFLLIAIITITFQNISFGQFDTSSLTVGQKFFITSKYTNTKIEIWIKLPEDFEKLRGKCDLLVLLDGDEYFKMASDITALYEFGEKIRPTIVVGLPSSIESRWTFYTPTNVKYEDFKADSLLQLNSGKFNQFADFIEKELIPEITIFYKTTFISKTIFGHSLGGLGTMSFYRYRPKIFENYIAASPSVNWDGHRISKYYRDSLPNLTKNNNKLFLSIGTPDMFSYAESVKALYKSIKMKTINSKNNIILREYLKDGHSTTGIRSLIDGLDFILEKSLKK